MSSFTPSVSTTIFPKHNFIRNFTERAAARDSKGRIFGVYGAVIDPGSDPTCFRVTFPHDLEVGTGAIYDLLEDCGTPTIIDLN